jgi:hypothetical protein
MVSSVLTTAAGAGVAALIASVLGLAIWLATLVATIVLGTAMLVSGVRP